MKYNISEKLQKDWQMDTKGKGFNKTRQKYYGEIKANKTLIGISVKELSTIFGRPDTLKNQNPFLKFDTNKVAVYFSACDCNQQNKVLSNHEWTQIHFEFVKDKLARVDFIVGN